MDIALNQPARKEQLKVRITGTAGYTFLGQDEDSVFHRFVIAFFQETPGSPDKTVDLEFSIMESGMGELHTISAIAVAGTEVIAADRKRIRSGVSES